MSDHDEPTEEERAEILRDNAAWLQAKRLGGPAYYAMYLAAKKAGIVWLDDEAGRA